MSRIAKRLAKMFVPRAWRTAYRNVTGWPERLARCEAFSLASKYADGPIAAPPSPSQFEQCEFKVHSQHGEDGIVLEIFSRIGVTDRRFVEFGFGNGSQCISANLSLNFGWQGLLMDASQRHVELAREFYRRRLGRRSANVKIVQCLVTADNIDATLAREGMAGQIDLLSIDVDGNDYWLWQAISAVCPRLVVIEYNASLGPERSVTVKYDANFDYRAKHRNGFYHGASLAALAKLARQRGYILAACDSSGTNAFFVHQGAASGKLDELQVPEAYYPPAGRCKALALDEQFDQIKHMDFEQV